MNTATATHLTRAFSALSLALLISGTSYAGHKSDALSDYLYPPGDKDAPQRRADCARGGESAAIIFSLGGQPTGQACTNLNGIDAAAPAPIRLAKPLSGTPYMRSGHSIRYSF